MLQNVYQCKHFLRIPCASYSGVLNEVDKSSTTVVYMMHLPTLGIQPGLLLFAFTTVPVTAQTLVTLECWIPVLCGLVIWAASSGEHRLPAELITVLVTCNPPHVTWCTAVCTWHLHCTVAPVHWSTRLVTADTRSNLTVSWSWTWL